MGDWIPMEVKKKRTLSGLFIRYISVFCISTVLLILVFILILNGLINAGAIYPANYMEVWINDNRNRIVEAEKVTEELIPEGSSYGVYDVSGKFLYGNFDGKDRENVWEAYMDNNAFAGDGGIYRFLLRKDGEVCIVKYYLKTQAANPWLRKYLPAPDICMIVIFIAVFLIQAVWIAKRFANVISIRLKALNDMTEKIQDQNLEIGEPHSDIWEIDEVLMSLSRMGMALRRSLEEQWRMESRRREQIAALAHDIKTPLTVIKGNAELLCEEAADASVREYTRYIRENTDEIENYLVMLQEMLLSEENQEKLTVISAQEMAKRLAGRAKELAAGYPGGQVQVRVMNTKALSGGLTCDITQIKRAWDNIVSNALEYTHKALCHSQASGTDRRRSLMTAAEIIEEEGDRYLAVRILDGGNGFTKEELLHAAEQFYQGDKSRHEKNHRGLGLYTASRFADLQGGKLVIENASEDGYGGKVTLLLKLDKMNHRNL